MMPAATIYLETFGCQMNELDSELVSGALRRLGYGFTPDPEAAGVILYNTCSVREHAEQKVWSRLGELSLRRERQPRLVVGVLGCMAERDGLGLVRRFPVVDILCGPGELDRLPELLDNAVRTRRALPPSPAPDRGGGRVRDAGECHDAATDAPPAPAGEGGRQVALQGNASRRSATLAAAEDSLELLDLSRAISPIDADPDRPRGAAYVRITRGCNKFCTYCVVPFTRGAEVHRPPDHIVDECRRLADAGVIEVTLLGQTVNHYRFEHGAAVSVNGLTQPQKGRSYAGGHARDPFAGERVTTFAGLLRRIHDEVPAIRRLRFVTSYPRDFGDDVLEVMRDSPRICRYLHAPAQSGSDEVLKRMNRGYTAGEYMDFLARARAFLHRPEQGRPLMVAGDIIVGFPGESDEDFARTVDLVRAARYKNCFVFKYSPRPGTTAYGRLPDDVPEEVKRRRNNELLAVQAAISDEIGRAQVGRTVGVFVEGPSLKERKRREPGGNGVVQLTVGGRASAAGVLDAPADPGPCQLSGRTDGDLIVFCGADASRAERLVGTIAPVRITGADRLSLYGELADA